MHFLQQRWPCIVLGVLIACGTATTTRAADYYFSAAGSDAAGNGSSAQPWRSIAKFNALNLNAGDNVYFRASDTFDGRLLLDEQDSGVDGHGQLVAPVRIGTYGSPDPAARAIIRSPANSEGLFAYNSSGIELRDLEFSSGGSTTSARKSGVLFYTDKSQSAAIQKLHHLRVDNVVSHGFNSSGIEVYAENSVGYADVQIVRSEFYANAYGGINVGAANWQDLVHADVVIDQVQTHANPGYAGCAPHCGHGAVLGQVDGAVIQNSMAYGNGVAHGAGNVGLWAWQSNEVVIQNNLAYGNRSPSGGDGGAFDLDGGVTNSLVQYNRSYDNDGAGLLLAQFASADPMSQNVFRYNLSVNDGRDGYGGITVWGATAADGANSALFHNNTIVVDEIVAPNARGAVWFLNQNHDDVVMVNNALIALNGSTLISGTTTASRASLVGNAYWSAGGPVILEDANYATVMAWALAENQERLGGVFIGMQSDPALIPDGSYRPAAFSPLVDAGLLPGNAPWPAWAVTLGPTDLRGLALVQDLGAEIGALEILTGDFDGDADVDAVDLQTWRANFTAGGPGAMATDLDGDGDTDGDEFLQWQRRLNVTPTLLPGAVPEPSSLCLVAVAISLGSCRLRRRPGESLSKNCSRWRWPQL